MSHSTTAAPPAARHPLTIAREQAGLSITQLALCSGANYSTIRETERGRRDGIGDAVLPAVRFLGLDAAELAAEHAAWLAAQRQEAPTP